VRLRHAARLIRGTGFPHEYQGRESGDLPFFKVGDLSRPSRERLLTECENWIDRGTAELLRARPAPAGSVLLPKIGAAMLLRTRRITSRESVFDNNVLAVVPFAIEPRYLRYWLETVDLAELANPGPVPSLEEGALLDLAIPVREATTQSEVADFLDAETARIYGLIEKRRRMIELLRERWAAARRLAVTRGLNPSVETRPTGALWLDRIPASWTVSKLQHLGSIQSGHTPSTDREDYWDGDIPWVSPKDMKRFDLDSTEECVSQRATDETGLALVEPGSVLFVVRGMILAHTFPVALSSVPVTINQDMKALTVAREDPRFVAHLLAGVSDSILSLLVEESAHGTRVLRMERWKDFPLVLPPVEEQHLIVAYLDAEAKRTAAVVAGLKNQIDLLGERRQGLIIAAVRGQLDLARAAA
jgi:restriction endonuclease S subunit